MNIPRFWARAGDNKFNVRPWQSSEVSIEDARQKAQARAAELSAKFDAGADLDRYGYGDRPMREEIIQTLANEAGKNLAVITRNLYGALVLNTAGAMLMDVDFAKAKDAPRVTEQVGTWARKASNLSLRIYRTFAGLRCLVVNRIYDPTSLTTIDLLHSIGSDPLYIRLCKAQSCFRARLTPKPWRCGTRVPPARYPWAGSQQEASFRKWQGNYERLSQNYCVCRLVEQIGPAEVHPDIQPLIALHDQIACARPDRPLA